MNKIGIYGGRKVFRVDLTAYVGDKLYNDSENIYLIDEDLILENEVIGKYDGRFVEELDKHKRYTFFHNSIASDGNQHFTYSTGESKNADDLFNGVYDTDYSKYFTDLDEFLKS